MEKNEKRLYLYRINIDYIKYLHSFCKEVYYDEKNSEYDNKPYFGILINNNGVKYFIPLTSAKEKHKRLKNSSDNHILIYENVAIEDAMKMDTSDWVQCSIFVNEKCYIKHLIAVLNFAKMIPVPDGLFYKEPIDSMTDSGRKRLLSKEREFLLERQDTIIKKATRLYEKQIASGKIHDTYCDFALLENKYLEYELPTT